MSKCQLLLDTEEKKFFREIYETYRDEMFYTAYVILENVQDTEDALQEAFIAVLRNIDKIKGNPPQKNWNYIATIVKHKAIDLYNKRKKRIDKELPLTEKMVEDIVDEAFDIRVLTAEQREILIKLLKEVNEEYCDVLLLRYYHGLSCVEIGKILGREADAVRHMVWRAKRSLQRKLKEKGIKR